MKGKGKKELKCPVVTVRFWTDYMKPGNTCWAYGVVYVPSQRQHKLKSTNRRFNHLDQLSAKVKEAMEAAGAVFQPTTKQSCKENT
jgi:hypothetical protein